jgi:serine/threonine protein kinase
VSLDSVLVDGAYRLCPRCHYIYPGNSKFCGRDQSELVDDERILAGKFLLLRKIGEGNMGAVWEAEQPQIGRTVAVKILKPDPDVMLRFEREVKASGAINHKNVVTVYDSGVTDDGRGYIAMELLEGESLGQHLETHPVLAPTRALEIWTQAVRAMSAAHAKGIVHRDLKPDNVFLTRTSSDEGHETVVKVLDFGISKFNKGAPPSKGTAPGMIVGTMQYMSPEQLQGAEADPRADVYALGLLLVEMLTGRLPWGVSKAQAFSLYALRMVQPPMSLHELLPEQPFSPELQRLVDDLLAIDPEKRPAHAGELLPRLKQVPEASGFFRPDGRGGPDPTPAPVPRASSSGIRSGTQFVDGSSIQGQLPVGAALRTYRLPVAIGLAVVSVVAVVAFALKPWGSQSPARVQQTPDLGAAVVEPKVSSPEPKDKPPETPANPKLAHRPLHASPPLQVQFAFAEARGLQLSCAGKKQAAPSCSGDGLCKSVVTVQAGQKCTVDKDKLKKVYTYSELQKTPPDRKNFIHVLVRF